MCYVTAHSIDVLTVRIPVNVQVEQVIVDFIRLYNGRARTSREPLYKQMGLQPDSGGFNLPHTVLYQIASEKFLVPMGPVIPAKESSADQAVTAPIHTADTASAEMTQEGELVVVPHSVLPFQIVDTTSDEIRTFLSRPIVVATITWNTAFATRFDRFISTYLTNASIVRRLYGYGNIRFTPHLSFTFNPSPYHYGEIVVAAEPSANAAYSLSDNSIYTEYHKPKVILSAGYPKVVEMKFPWWHTHSYMDISESNNPNDTPYTGMYPLVPLGSCAAAVADITITVRAWLTDVQLVSPSSCVPWAASKFERKSENDSFISGPASAVANFAGGLSKVPVIGRFAKAVEIGASAVSSIAQLFGFSRPNKAVDTVVVLDAGLEPATTNGWVHAGQISWDNQCQLTVDPGVAGGSRNDEMSLATWFQRPSLIGIISWSLGHAAGTKLWQLPVSPMFCQYNAGPTPDVYYPTCIGYASLPFGYWRGSLIYNIRVVANQYFKGRLRVQYEPTQSFVAGEPYGLLNSCILDTNENSDVDLVVGWSNFDPMRRTGPFVPITADVMSAYDVAINNGQLVVYVEAPLLSQTGVGSGVYFVITVRGGDDYVVGGAGANNLNGWNLSTPASSITKRCVITGSEPGADPSLMLLVMGERVESVRAVIKRFSYYQTLSQTVVTGGGTGAAFQTYAIFGRPAYNHDPVSSFIGSTNTYRASTTLYTWYQAGYAGVRGGVRFWLKSAGTNSDVDISVYRVALPTATTSSPSTPGAGAGVYGTSAGAKWLANAWNGLSICNKTVAGVVVDFNCYNNLLYENCNSAYASKVANNRDGGIGITVSSKSTDGTAGASLLDPNVEVYVAGAEDTTFLYFLGAPTVQVATWPT